MNSSDGWGDDVYQPDGSEVQDDAGLLDAEDTLEDDGVGDPLDRGWSPPERPWAVEHTGVTAADRETLDERLAEELPEAPYPKVTASATTTAATANSWTTRSAPAAPAGSSPPTRAPMRTTRVA